MTLGIIFSVGDILVAHDKIYKIQNIVDDTVSCYEYDRSHYRVCSCRYANRKSVDEADQLYTFSLNSVYHEIKFGRFDYFSEKSGSYICEIQTTTIAYQIVLISVFVAAALSALGIIVFKLNSVWLIIIYLFLCLFSGVAYFIYIIAEYLGRGGVDNEN